MRRTTAALGSMIFFVLAPGVVAGFCSRWLTGWRVRQPLVLGRDAAASPRSGTDRRWRCRAGTGIHAFRGEGVGTPAPIAPTQKLVVGGLYRYVRNPMYLAVLAAIVGQALVLSQDLAGQRRLPSVLPWLPSSMATKNRPG